MAALGSILAWPADLGPTNIRKLYDLWKRESRRATRLTISGAPPDQPRGRPIKIAADESEQLGDTSSLADPAVVTDLVETHSRLHLPQAPWKQGK